ncbi:ParA family protein [Diaphorobacter sp. DS2]|nr:ParA family protein [Diaphorobacter sp. DS2]
MTKVISFANQKGGVGKSTLCIQAAFYLAEKKKKKVLVVDMDGQGNTSSRLAPQVVDENGDRAPAYSGTKSAELFRKKIPGGIKVMPCPCGADLIHTPKNDPELFEKEAASLAEAMHPRVNTRELFAQYDYVLIDCPPSLGRNLIAALSMAEYVVSPIKLSGFAVDGIEGLLTTVIGIQQEHNPELKMLGIVINDMIRSVSHERAFAQIKAAVPDLLFKNVIMNRPPIDTATSDGVPVWSLRYGHVAAREVKAVLEEMLRKAKK